MDHLAPSVTTAPAVRARPLAGLALIALTAMGLGGCSVLKAPSAAELALACPKVSIVRDAQEVTHFGPGGGHDLTNVASRAAMPDYDGNCEYDSGGVTVNVNIGMVAERGPALQGGADRYQYFVAVYRPGQEAPANKVVFDTGAKFSAEDTRVTWIEQVAPRIPLPKDTNAQDWRVVIGFQLTAAELEYNRSQLKKGR